MRQSKSKLDSRLYPHCAKHGITAIEGAVSFADFGKFLEKTPALRDTADYWMHTIGAHHKNALRAGDVEQFIKGVAKGIL